MLSWPILWKFGGEKLFIQSSCTRISSCKTRNEFYSHDFKIQSISQRDREKLRFVSVNCRPFSLPDFRIRFLLLFIRYTASSSRLNKSLVITDESRMDPRLSLQALASSLQFDRWCSVGTFRIILWEDKGMLLLRDNRIPDRDSSSCIFF